MLFLFFPETDLHAALCDCQITLGNFRARAARKIIGQFPDEKLPLDLTGHGRK
jgi:hypothetical protein